MVVDVLLGILCSCGKLVVQTSLVVERHILCRTQILREFLGHVETRVGVSLDLQAIHLATLGGNQNSTFCTFGAIEYDSLRTLEEGNLLDFRRQHVVGRTLHTVDDDEWKVAVVVGVKTVVVHTPQVATIPSADKGIHVFKTTHRIVLLRQLFHVDIRNASEKLVGILVAKRNMDFLFCHD